MIKATAAGDAAVLFDTSRPPWLAAAINAAALPGVRDVVPGARSVLVIVEPGSIPLDELAATVSSLPVAEPVAGVAVGLVEIPVIYDGPDLADVARLAGMAVQEVIARHSGGLYTVGWLGFAPGFGYLTGLDQRLHDVPRLPTPRLTVPAGSVAIAAGLAAVYPSASPGGWRLLGRTTARTWDPDREPPALFTPGTKVRFTAISDPEAIHHQATHTAPEPHQPQVPTTPSIHHQPPHTHRKPHQPQVPLALSTHHQPPHTHREPHQPQVPPGHRIEVVRPGPFATVQDLGRPGSAALGVPPSGAADPASLIAANRLAGNPDGAAGIELTLGRATFRCRGGVRLAVTGAPAAVTLAIGAGQPALAVDFGTSFEVPHGSLVSIGAPAIGLRTYVAVAGGLTTTAVLGSRSADVLSGLGGGALRPGDVLPVGSDRRLEPAPPPPTTAIPARGSVASLRVIEGPRLDWFEAEALATLCGSVYTVSPASNRTGLRLAGPPVPRLADAELPSEGMVTGSLEVPPDGQPILLLADHPTVGGYPVLAVVASADIPLAAQLRPGHKISFTTPA